MLKNTRLQMIAVLAVGALLGYVAASGNLDVFRKATAEPSKSPVGRISNPSYLETSPVKAAQVQVRGARLPSWQHARPVTADGHDG
jgi:hypothetical protein